MTIRRRVLPFGLTQWRTSYCLNWHYEDDTCDCAERRERVFWRTQRTYAATPGPQQCTCCPIHVTGAAFADGYVRPLERKHIQQPDPSVADALASALPPLYAATLTSYNYQHIPSGQTWQKARRFLSLEDARHQIARWNARNPTVWAYWL